LPYDLADEERPGAAPEGWITWIPNGKSTNLGESMKGIPGLVNIQKAIENGHRNSYYS